MIPKTYKMIYINKKIKGNQFTFYKFQINSNYFYKIKKTLRFLFRKFYFYRKQYYHMISNKKILIIDDSNTNIVLLEAILTTHGFKPFTAQSVKEAIPIIEKEHPELILLDLLMPEVSGFDFLEEISINSKLNSIPVIVVSALTDENNVSKTKELGAVEFIKKPVDIQTLIDSVEKILESPLEK